MEVTLAGTVVQPEVQIVSVIGERVGAQSLTDWAKSHGGRWKPERKIWLLTALGPRPSRTLAKAGVDEYGIDDEFEDVNLDDLARPLVGILADNHRMAVVYPRLLGFEACRDLLPLTAHWDKAGQRFRLPLTDVVSADGEPLDERLSVSERVCDAAVGLHGEVFAAPLPEPGSDTAIDAAFFAEQIDDSELTEEDCARIPEWFGLDLFGFQKAGALAVADGHTLLADAMGVGKTRSSLAAVSVLGSTRTLFVVPPVVLTNWGREISASRLVEHSGEGAELVVLSAKRKEQDLPVAGAVVVSDSLLKARPHLFEALIAWHPTALVYDEAHRAKTPTTAVAQRMREIASYVDGPRIALTGTPVLNSTAEIAPILAITGHLDTIFGGFTSFMETYCRQDRFGAWRTNKRKTTELKELLDEHVWVRRTKADVLPNLPKKMRTADFVDVDLREYRKAHKDVEEKILDWLRADYAERPPSDAEILAFAQDSIGLSSPMRRAAGLAKSPVAGEIVAEWVEENPASDGVYDRPLLLWAHHKDVVTATAEAAKEAGAPTAVIDGSTPAEDRQAITDAFQAGELAVLVCSIAAASVGITLTHGADMIFVEQDWTPALNAQAEDRMARIGQTRPVSIRTLLAADTLDEHMYATLEKKAEMLDSLLVGGDNRVTVDVGEGELSTSTQIVIHLITGVVERAYTKSGKLKANV